MLSELGVPGLAIVLLLHLTLVFAAGRAIRRIEATETRLLVAGLAAPLVAMLVAWFTTTTTANTPLSPYFWFAAGGLAYWAARSPRRDHALRDERGA